MAANRVDALVIFGATGDLAKLETFPALVGLVERGVLDVPVIGVAKSGWGLEQFRDYAAASLQLQQHGPGQPGRGQDARPAPLRRRRPRRRRHLQGDVGRDRRGQEGAVLPGGAAAAVRPHRRRASPRPAAPRAPGSWWRSRSAHDLASAAAAQRRPCTSTSRGRHLPGRPLARPGPGGERAVRPVRQLDHRAAAEPDLRGEHPDHHGRGVRRRRPGPRSTTGPARSGTCSRTTCCRCWPPCWPSRRTAAAWPPGGTPRHG